MRTMKLALLVELELGCVWTLLLLAMPRADLGSVMLFFLIYPIHLVCMIGSVVCFCRRPETRPLAAVVFITPIVLFLVPIAFRTSVGGAVAVHPWAWLSIVGLPLGACLFLPHHVAGFLPTWALRSRWLNVSTVVVLVAMFVPWLILLVLLGIGGVNPQSGTTIETSFGPIDETQAAWFVGAIVFVLLSTIVAGLTFLTSYVGLFQRVDRSQQKLRVVQVILSAVLLVPTVPALVFGLFMVMVAFASPG